MNPNITSLHEIANKPNRKIIGLMSGTSFDGLDIALCEFRDSGLETQVKVLNFSSETYPSDFKEDLKSIFAKQNVDFEKLTILNAFIGKYYAELILKNLSDWGIAVNEIDLIASHGQTVFHAPKHQRAADSYPNATLQIGDGDHIAVATGIITISDFRQKHVAVGCEGAPLSVYGDYLLFSSAEENRIMLNIGGISNFTFLPAKHSTDFFSSDVGPGNTLMDQFVQQHYPGKYFDEDARIASSGTVNPELLDSLFSHDFFKSDYPKTTGPELFSLAYLSNAISKTGLEKLSNEDILATLAAFTAKSIVDAVRSSVGSKGAYEIYISGGGMHNPLLLHLIEEQLGKKLKFSSDLGIAPDAKEAVLFALLGNEAVAGGHTNFGAHPGVPSISMGKISFPR
ncbi:anhydro-N-acetylmuramic acid kinase [Daejeonella sp.]|uniref:anhydro-N-acetylmuramic acid kinase n=1 Tax=Daejeonella sp. TaxID=2805397 RepID=UPI0025C016D1|nr:anhydro-N-acetylmuramic acid kinase [Daejeonella sp.]